MTPQITLSLDTAGNLHAEAPGLGGATRRKLDLAGYAGDNIYEVLRASIFAIGEELLAQRARAKSQEQAKQRELSARVLAQTTIDHGQSFALRVMRTMASSETRNLKKLPTTRYLGPNKVNTWRDSSGGIAVTLDDRFLGTKNLTEIAVFTSERAALAAIANGGELRGARGAATSPRQNTKCNAKLTQLEHAIAQIQL